MPAPLRPGELLFESKGENMANQPETLRPNTRFNLEETFETDRPTTKAMFERARGLLAGGVSHQSRFAVPFPIYVERAEGARKWDVDGNAYIDYAMGSASLMLGHAYPAVVAAIQSQAALGTFFANCHPLEVEWAELIQFMLPSAERVRFVGSGSEATSLAVRIARAYAEKPRIIRFEGHYHGWHDHLITGVAKPFDQPPTLGVLPESVASTVVCPVELSAVAETLERDDGIAGIIIETSGASWGTIPLPEGFLAGLRELADSFGVVLIFDEVITGFRFSPGGVQARIGVTPDLTTLAKILTGGMPGGAVAGKAEIMHLLDPAEETQGKRPGVSHRGTFNGNPVVAASGLATLKILKDGAPQRIADARARAIRDGLAGILERHEVAGAAYGESSTFHLYFDAKGRTGIEGATAAELKGIPKETVATLNRGLRTRGVELMSYTGGTTSSAHGEDDVAKTLEAFDDVIQEMVSAGQLARRA